MAVCFDGGPQYGEHVTVGESFPLGRLPYAPGCDRGYCTVASGL